MLPNGPRHGLGHQATTYFGHGGGGQAALQAGKGPVDGFGVEVGQGAAQLFGVQDGIAAHVQPHQPHADDDGQAVGIGQGMVGGLGKIGEHEQRKGHESGGKERE